MGTRFSFSRFIGSLNPSASTEPPDFSGDADTSSTKDTEKNGSNRTSLDAAHGTQDQLSVTEPATKDQVSATTSTTESSHADQREPANPNSARGPGESSPRGKGELQPEKPAEAEVGPQTEEGEEEEEGEEGREKYVQKVKRRLMDAWPGMGPDKATRMAETLTDQKKTREHYFKHLLEQQKEATAQARKATKSDATTFEKGYHNTAEKNEAREGAANQMKRVGQLQVRLLIYELNQQEWKKVILRKVNRYLSQFQYGPFHVALLIGDVLLEWDVRGVVIPRRLKTNEKEKLLFSASVHFKEELSVSHVAELDLRAGQGAMAMSYSNQLNAIVELGERREMLIDELARVTVLYNRKFDYGVFRCNCQTFVVDVLQVLGIQNVEETFQGKLRVKEHKNLLLKHGNDKPVFDEFNSHADLDTYVRENIDKLSLDDLEFCHCHYLLFHAWHKKQPGVPAWQCSAGGCCFRDVERRLS